MVDNKLYTPGSLVPSSPGSCTQCICTSFLNSITKLNIVICVPISCNKTCEPGEKYENIPGQCCGKCVQKSCSVTTPDGQNKVLEIGEIWAPNSCTIYKCTKLATLQPFITVITKTCEYNSIKDCSTGEKYIKPSTGQCCGKCVQTHCVITLGNGIVTLLLPGDTVPDPTNPCISYSCTKVNEKLYTEVHKTICKYQSAQDCQEGEQYKVSRGKCCGECIPSACNIITPSGENATLKAGESWPSPKDKCISYGCTQVNGKFYSVLNNNTCTAVNAEDCESGVIEVSENGCCSRCKAPTNCRLEVGSITLLTGDCPLTLTIPYCTGVCKSPIMTNSMEPLCTCCKKLKSKKQTVEVKCKNGTTISQQYDYIESCGCSTKLCDSQG
ncbi:mucin-5B-like [Hyla sarda]|uniref:mucin-5B-like n=1 Tax=Hyla sarda TaxID=327740 RepID=UPI0024C319A5|nr:mucin-5B-like [Hyla sarda]